MPDPAFYAGSDVKAAGETRAWHASLDPETRRAIYSLARDLRPSRNLMILVFGAIWLAAGALVLAYPIWVVKLPGYLVMGASLHALGILMHEAVHGNFFRRRPIDRVAAFLLGAPALVSGAAYRVTHLLHHRYNRGARDPDELSNYGHSRRLLSFVFYSWTLFGMLAFLVHVPVNALRHGTPRQRREVVAECGVLLLIYAAVIATALQQRAVAALGHVWLAPLVVSFVIVNLRGWSEHLLTVPGHPLTQTRTVTSNAVVRFFLCNLNYHLEHHLFPAVPWYHLPRLHGLLREEFQRAGAFTYRSYARFFWDALREGIHGLAPARRGPAGAPPGDVDDWGARSSRLRLRVETVSHPGPAPYALGAYAPLLVGGATWSGVTGNFAWWQPAAYAAAGLALWSILEYLFHRHVFHIVPRAPWLLERQQHLQHHRLPSEPAFQVVPLRYSMPIAIGLTASLRLALGTWPAAILIASGVVTGYLGYELVHYWIHMGGRAGSVLRRLRRHHFYHHYRDDERCFGVTTPIWDLVFGTGRPTATRPLDQVRSRR